MTAQDFIATRRDGREHTEAEIRSFVEMATSGSMPDYQVAAWLMAAYLNPLTPQETAWLTLAMAESGEKLDLGNLPKPWVDKHSTGGVGDKVTLVALPLLASCGVTAVKMSGRGLGITGGTIDKLESVPGFRVDLSPEEMVEQASRIGIALTGQTPALAPADKKLYALRDATGTVSNIPLIVSSILSKKLAGGAETVVLDVKSGSGGFMRTLTQARELAQSLKSVALLAGLNVRLVISDMDQPLGRACGNALEVQEAVEILSSGDPAGRVARLSIELVALTLQASGRIPDLDEAREFAVGQLQSGAAKQKAQQWFEAQGAPADFFDRPTDYLAVAPVQIDLIAQMTGTVERVDAERVGRCVVALGGGRERKEDQIDPSVGVEVFSEVGAGVERGASLARIHAKDSDSARTALFELTEAFMISEEEVIAQPLIQDIL